MPSVWAAAASRKRSAPNAISRLPLDGRPPVHGVLPSDPAGFRAGRMLHGAPSDGPATLVGPHDRHRPHHDPRCGPARGSSSCSRAQAARSSTTGWEASSSAPRSPAGRSRRARRPAAGRHRRPPALDAAVDRRDDDADRRAAHEARRRDGADASAGEPDLAARACPSPAEGGAASGSSARESPSRPAAPSAYEMQYGFKSGERVDAVIKVEKLIPIDAKFPLDNFQRMVEAEDDASRTLYEKAFARDMKGTSTPWRRSTSSRRRAPTTSRSCTCRRGHLLRARVRQDRCAPRSCPREAHLPHLGHDVHCLPAGDRVWSQGNGVRAERPRGDGVRRRSPQGLPPSPGGLRARPARTSRARRRSTSTPRSDSTVSTRSSSGRRSRSRSTPPRPHRSSKPSTPHSVWEARVVPSRLLRSGASRSALYSGVEMTTQGVRELIILGGARRLRRPCTPRGRTSTRSSSKAFSGAVS